MNIEKEIIQDELITLTQNIVIIENKLYNGCNTKKGNQLLNIFQRVKQSFLHNGFDKNIKLIEKLPLLYIQMNKI